MINNVHEDPLCGFAFSNFRTKPSVLKRKLGTGFAKNEWNVSPASFGGDVAIKFEKRRNRKVLKYKIETLPKKNLATDFKSIPSPKRTEFIPTDSIGAEVHCSSPRNLKRSRLEENESEPGNRVSSKRPGSVFLEVQNIQSSFKKNNRDADLKPIITLPTEFSKKFKAEILCDDPRWTKKTEIPLTNGAIAQIKPCCKHSIELVRNHKVNRIENKCTESGNIKSDVRSSRNKVNCKSSVKAVSGFEIKADLTLKHVDNISCSFLNENSIEVTDFSKKAVNGSSCFPIKLDLTSKQIDNIQNIHFILDDKSSSVSEFSKKLSEKADIHFQIETDPKAKQYDPKNESNTLTDIKSPNIFDSGKTSKIYFSSKKKSGEKNAFQNFFWKHKSDIRTLSPKFAHNFKSNLLPKRDEEPGHLPKKLKVDKFTFAIPSDLSPSNVACNVKRINISASTLPRPEKEDFVLTTAEKPSNGFATNFELSSANAEKDQSIKFIRDNESSFQDNSSISEISLVDFSRLLENKSDGSKGSDWMQSLKPTLTEENDETDQDQPIKKKIRNILPGGFAEQMLKLQRRENSEKVIWSHKIHKNKRKAQKDSLYLILKSITSIEEFIIVKASLAAQEESQSLSQTVGNRDGEASLYANDTDFSHLKLNSDGSKDPLTSDIVFILLKRKAFTRLQLKVNDVFKVYQPWQTFHLKSIPYPFILCAYFIDVVSSSCPGIPSELDVEGNITVTGLREAPSLLKQSALPETATHGDLLFFKREELVTFSARIQRIWKKEFKVRNPNGSSAGTKYLRYSVLLQIREGTFHELRILPDSIPDLWKDVISQGEGKCFHFHNLSVTHRTHLERDKYLRDILEAFHLQNGGKLEQGFCYQLMFDSSSRCPEEIAQNGFPGYCPVTFQPLLQVFEMRTCERFTCRAKVLLQYKDVYYVSDESLLDSPSLKYVQVQFLTTAEVRSSLTGSVVLIKEALVEEGSLLIDNYSQLIPLFEASHSYQLEDISKAKIQTNVCLEKVISFLHMFSEVEDLVCIKGEIASVDESAAFTWLQCSFCLQENLVQDTNLVIYCEDCSRIVPSPILNVKLEVVVEYPQMPSAKVNIQLLSTTTKRILQIPEGTCQPQCSVCDVLGKEIGPLYCFVRSCDVTCDKPVFYLSEVCSS